MKLMASNAKDTQQFWAQLKGQVMTTLSSYKRTDVRSPKRSAANAKRISEFLSNSGLANEF